MKSLRRDQSGVTLIELMISMGVVALIIVSILGLFTSMVKSSVVAKRQAVASTLATNQMEYLKSLPYDSLGVVGGIYVPSPLPATSTQKVDGVTYTVKTSINYVDDAYDGCADTTITIKQKYCRNYAGTTVIDGNPQDYKIAHVSVTDKSALNLAEVDSQISAKVSETASTTGAMFITVVDDNGNPVSGANIKVQNPTVAPAVDRTDDTDSNGVAIFYGLAADSGYDYTVTATKSGSSSLVTIPQTGSLQPTYPSQKVVSQKSSYVTMTLKQQGTNSLLVEATDTNGSPLSGAKIYIKGGYKQYNDSTNTQYCYDNMILNGTSTICSTSATTSDSRPTTDASGMAALTNLVPGAYMFCGDVGATNCKIGSTTYYLAVAVPYGGVNAFNPVAVPTYNPSSPPTTTFGYNSVSYLQKVRLMLTASSTFPRVLTMTPSNASQATDNMSNFALVITGVNMPCNTTAATCGTTVKFLQGSSTFTAACTGPNTSTSSKLNCTVNLTSATQGGTQLIITSGGNTLTMPASPLLGGINVGS